LEKEFDLVATGGTFDVLHLGHLALLSKAFEISKKVIIGVTSDEFAAEQKGKKAIRYGFSKRVSSVRGLIESKYTNANYEISKLDTNYGPAVVYGSVEAIVTSSETAVKGEEINQIRIKHGLEPVAIIIVELVKAEDGRPISSTRIRAGEIDTVGKVLKKG
jgi:pantetheine-phosphate adenylyltransferase